MTADPAAPPGTPVGAPAGSRPTVGNPSTASDPGRPPGPAAAVNGPGSPSPGPAGAPDLGAPAAPTPSSRAQEAASRARKADMFLAAEARAAERHLDLATAGGDVVMGDKTEVRYELIGRAGSTFRAYQVSAEERASAFVEPPQFADLERSADGQVIVVLSGPVGHGKGTVLLRLLTGGPSGADAVFRLDPTTDLSALICDEVPEGAVLMLDDLTPERLSSLDGYGILRLMGQLGDRRCRLGITTTAVGVNLASGPGCIILRLPDRPEPRAVFDRHMAQHMLGRMAQWRALRDRPDVRELLDEHLDSRQHLAAAADLARRFAAVAHDPDTAVARLGQSYGDGTEECARWFAELGDIKAHCFAVALAVLDEMPRETVARAAEALEHLVAPKPENAILTAQAPNPFAVAAVVSATRLRAEIVGRSRATRFGDVREQIIRYLKKDYAGMVLRHVWHEHDWIRPALLAWFRQLGRHSDPRVRVRAATAVGVLGRESFELVVDDVIAVWAHDDNDEWQDSAAVALGPPLTDPILATTVRALVTRWSHARDSEDDVRLRATAARAYGTTIGARNPTAALRDLARLADDRELDVLFAVARSYRELATESTPALSVRVLGEVNRLAADRKPTRQLAAALTCTDLAMSRGMPGGTGDTVARPAWPSIVVLAVQRPETAPLLAELLARGISDRELGGPIGDEIEDWAVDAERDPDLGSAVVEMLVAVAAVDQRSAVNIYRRAQRWSARDGRAPITGRSVLRRFV